MRRLALGAGLCSWMVVACGSTVEGGAGGAGAVGGGGEGGLGAAGGTGGTGGASCESPLPEDTIEQLVFGIFEDFAVEPGASIDFDLGTVACCYEFVPVAACAVFSIEPATGASMDPATGLFTVEPTTEAGSIYQVVADVEDGRRRLSTAVTVYTHESNPLVGYWHEAAQLSCADGSELAAELPIGELWFKANGEFAVTWVPFEIYFDYWGSYAFDLGAQTLSLWVAGGNYVPPDVDPTGTFSFDGNTLVLHDLWLGTPQGGSAAANCGHRFE